MLKPLPDLSSKMRANIARYLKDLEPTLKLTHVYQRARELGLVLHLYPGRPLWADTLDLTNRTHLLFAIKATLVPWTLSAEERKVRPTESASKTITRRVINHSRDAIQRLGPTLSTMLLDKHTPTWPQRHQATRHLARQTSREDMTGNFRLIQDMARVLGHSYALIPYAPEF